MTVGERIKQRRIELGLTQEELALKMGYKGKTSVCVVETGGDNVTTTKVIKFAKALDVPVQYLLGDLDKDELEKSQAIIDYWKNKSSDEEDEEEIKIAIMKYKEYKALPLEVQKTIDFLLSQHQSDS